MENNIAYKCNNPACKCNKDSLLRHCPVCGELYLWDVNHPEKGCIDCVV